MPSGVLREGGAAMNTKPMLAKPVVDLPRGREWTYEVKWDGYRLIAVKEGPHVRLLSRNQHDMTADFPSIARAVAALPPKRAVFDGELVALDKTGRPSFTGLQERHRHIATGNQYALAFYVFDLLEVNGRSWRRQPLSARRRRLASLIRGDTVLLSRPLPGTVEAIIRRVRQYGLEGVVAKRRGSPYQSGERSSDWQKVRFSPRQEFVVGGYVPKDGAFDSLLVGFYREGRLQYAGRVREGFTPRTRAALALRLRLGGVRDRCPFDDLPHDTAYAGKHPWDQRMTKEDMRGIRWLSPAQVIEVSYLGWARHGLLRQGRFVGLREDKAADAVCRE
jgi:bifunctional non-homologous end joining protein LigD